MPTYRTVRKMFLAKKACELPVTDTDVNVTLPPPGLVALTPAQHQAISRRNRTEAGGKQIAVMLTPAAAAKLSAWVARGETIAGVINRLLTRSKP